MLNNEIKTLAYPKAALFAFCVGLVAYMVLAAIEGALRAAHGTATIEAELSYYSVALEIQQVSEGMAIAVPDELWAPYERLSGAELAAILLAIAGDVPLDRYKKARRKKPAAPKTKRTRFKNRPHISTFRLLNKMPQSKRDSTQ